MSNRMPKADLSKLSPSEQEFMKRLQQENLIRVAKLQKVRRNNLITLGILCSTALGIYGYTIFSVKQETFLDDFNEPLKTTK